MWSADPESLDGLTIAVAGDGAASKQVANLLAGLGIRTADPGESADALIEAGSAAVIEQWARSGAMWLTGCPTGPPNPMHPGAATVLHAATLLLRTLSRLRTGVDPALPDVTLLGERAAIAGLVRRPGCSVGGAARSIRARDGWCVISLPRAEDLAAVPALVADAGGIDCGSEPSDDGDPWPTLARWASARPAAYVVDRAQLLGVAAAAVPHDDSPLSAPSRSVSRSPRPSRLLGGRRRVVAAPLVVDLSALWAGPLCASLLSMTGADVVKVESVHRLDGGRCGPRRFYDLLHAGHRSVVLDLAAAAGRQQLAELIDAADVVVDSSRPRALAQLGIDAAAAVAAGTIWTSITGYGRCGPLRHRIGFGDDVAASAGLVAVIDGVPVPCGDAVADPLAGAYAAAATAAALLGAAGRLIDVSMHRVAATAAAISGEQCEIDGSATGGWHVQWAGGTCRVEPPSARPHRGRAAAPGADNDAVLAANGTPCAS